MKMIALLIKLNIVAVIIATFTLYPGAGFNCLLIHLIAWNILNIFCCWHIRHRLYAELERFRVWACVSPIHILSVHVICRRFRNHNALSVFRLQSNYTSAKLRSSLRFRLGGVEWGRWAEKPQNRRAVAAVNANAVDAFAGPDSFVVVAGSVIVHGP